MKMIKKDYAVYNSGASADGQLELNVVAHFSGMGLEWPKTIVHEGKEYKYECNEAMKGWMVGKYSGHARYLCSV